MRLGLIRIAASVPLALALYMVATSPSHLRWLALLTVVAACLVYLWVRGHQWAALTIALVCVNAGLYSGVLTDENLWGSVAARVELTTNTLAMWIAAPFQGHGIGSFNHQYPLFQEAHAKLFPWMGTLFDKDMGNFAGAAHNEVAQILSDYGLFGFAIAGAVVWFLFGEIRDNLDRAAIGTLILGGAISLVEFPFQNPHTGAVLAVAAGISCNGRGLLSVRIPRPPAFAVALPLAAFVMFVSGKSWAAHKQFSYTQTLLAKDPLLGVAYNVAAYNEFTWPRHIRYQLAISMAVATSRDPDSIIISPEAADKMFRVSEGAGGKSTAVQIARIEYLTFSGRAVNHIDEIESRLAWLRENARLQNVTWLAESRWAVMTQDIKRASEAVLIAQSMPSQLPGYTEQINQIAQAIK